MDQDQQMNSLKMGMDICMKTVSGAVYSNLDDEQEMEKSITILRKLMHRYIKQEQDYLNGMSAIANARSRLRELSDEVRQEVDVDAIYEKEMEKAGKTQQRVDNHPMMEAFEAEVKAEKKKYMDNYAGDDSADDDDVMGGDDLVMTQMEGIPLDPITKIPIQDPVRNVYCSHVYERSSIMAVIARKKKTRCPIAGCANEAQLEANHIIDDSGLKRKIQKMKK